MNTPTIVTNVYKMFTNGSNLEREGFVGKYRYNPPKVKLYDTVKKDGTCGIFIQVIVQRKPDRIPLYIDVIPENFDGKYIDKKVPGASDNNLLIDNALARLNEINTEYRLARKDLTMAKLLHEYYHWETRFDFIAFMKIKIKERSRSVEQTTTDLHDNLLMKLTLFKPEIVMADLTLQFLNDFNAWLINRGNNSTTRRKEFENLRIFTNLAINAGIRIENPFTGFVLPTATDRIIFLLEDELKKLIDYYYTPDIPAHHERVLSGFLFMCFTGLRYSDAIRASRKMMFGNTLILIPKKSKRKGLTVNIPITDEAKNFMNGEGDLLLNYYTGCQANLYLKQITQLLGLWRKNVTNHVGRHTFATLFLMRGGSVVTLQTLLGHSDIKDTMKYVHIVDAHRDKEMKEAWAGMVPQAGKPEVNKIILLDESSNLVKSFRKEYVYYLSWVKIMKDPEGMKEKYKQRMYLSISIFREKYGELLNDKHMFIND